jgi:hypothetical protein
MLMISTKKVRENPLTYAIDLIFGDGKGAEFTAEEKEFKEV